MKSVTLTIEPAIEKPYQKVLTFEFELLKPQGYAFYPEGYLENTDDSKIKKPAILYFHGGGFIFGGALDIPKLLVELILDAGYPLICLNYPLVPEASFEIIAQFVKEACTALEFYTQELGFESVVVMGRSAGVSLACIAMQAFNTLPVSAGILLYGVYGLDVNVFKPKEIPGVPPLTFEHVQPLIRKVPYTKASVADRYLLYAFARQSGSWLELMRSDAQHFTAALNLDDIAQRIPCFLSACVNDPEVPYGETKRLYRKLKNAKLCTIYNVDLHDFDTQDIALGVKVYSQMLEWLEEVELVTNTQTVLVPAKELSNL